ncbi:MAG: hypothetical protein IKJ68_09970 [Clostridia bacterium]|nr:hypothetical protein [Clostridia bacterium]
MAINKFFDFAPAEWFCFKDKAVLDKVITTDVVAGNNFENPDFEVKVVPDVHNYFAIELFQRIRLSDVKNEKLVLILPSPENAVFISATEALNKFNVSCRNVHIFFLYEYANENGKVAPWQSPYSRSGHFMRYFYNRLKAELRMPMDQIHFWTDDNIDTYSKEIADLGGADVCFTALSWSGGIGAIDPEGFAAKDIEELKNMTSRLVTPMAEMIAHDSLRGMFGCAGDIANVPPKAVTVGPKDILSAKEWIDLEYLVACGGSPAHQKFPLRLALYGPICPENPASLMRTHKGTCYVANEVASPWAPTPDFEDILDVLEDIRKKEEGGN